MPEARFDFGTNVAAIVDEIGTQLSSLEAKLASAGGKMSNAEFGAGLASAMTSQFTRMLAEGESFAAKMQATMAKAMGGGAVSGPSVVRQLETAVQQQATAIQASGSRIPASMRTPELESQMRTQAAEAMRPLLDMARRLPELGAASLAAGRSVAETARIMGSAEKNIEAAQRRIRATADKAINNPLPSEPYRTVYRGESAESRSAARASTSSPQGRFFQEDYQSALAHAGPGGRVVAADLSRKELERAQESAAKLGSINTAGTGDYYLLSAKAAQAARRVDPTVGEPPRAESLETRVSRERTADQPAVQAAQEEGGKAAREAAAAARDLTTAERRAIVSLNQMAEWIKNPELAHRVKGTTAYYTGGYSRPGQTEFHQPVFGESGKRIGYENVPKSHTLALAELRRVENEQRYADYSLSQRDTDRAKAANEAEERRIRQAQTAEGVSTGRARRAGPAWVGTGEATLPSGAIANDLQAALARQAIGFQHQQARMAAGLGTDYEKNGSHYREDPQAATGKWFKHSGEEVDALTAKELELTRVRRLEAEQMQRNIAAGLRTGEFKQVGNSFQDLREGSATKGKYFGRAGTQETNPIAETALTDKLAHQSKNIPQAFLGGFTSKGRMAGEGGAVDKESLSNLAATAGTVAKYSLMYQALGALQGAGGGILSQVKDYTDSYTDLGVAISHVGDAAGGATSASQGFVNDLSEIARFSGSNPGEALDAAARGIRAFATDAGAATESTQAIGDAVAETTSRLALISGGTMKDVTGDVIAVGTAYGLTGQNISQVLDAVASAKDLGGDPRQISQGMASFAENAKAAGYNTKELANLMSLITERTDETGQVAAGKLGRIFSMFGSAGNQQFLRGVGVDTNATMKQQTEQLAKVYQGGTPALQGQIRNQFGGAQAVRELLPLLTEQDKLQQANAKSAKDAGRGAEEFFRKSNDLVGLLRKLSGDIKGIQVALARSDIFAPIGAGLMVLEPVLHGLEKMLNVYAKLPGAVKTAIAALIEYKIAMALVGSLFPKAEGGLPQLIRNVRGKAGDKVENLAAAAQGRESRVEPKVAPVVGKVDVAPLNGAVASAAAGVRMAGVDAVAAGESMAVLSPAAKAAAVELETSTIAVKLAAIRAAEEIGVGGESFRIAASTSGDFLPGASKRAAADLVEGGEIFKWKAINSGTSLGAIGAAGKDAVKRVPGRLADVEQAIEKSSFRKGLNDAFESGGWRGVGKAGASSIGEGISKARAGAANMGGMGRAMVGMAGATAIMSTLDAQNKTLKLMNSSSDLASMAGAKGGQTVEDLTQSANDLKTASSQLRQSSAGVTGTARNWLTGLIGGETTGTVARRTDAAAAFQDAQSKRTSDALALNAREHPVSAIDVTSPTGIDKGLDAIAKSGGNAKSQLEALMGALDGVATSSDKAARKLAPGAEIGAGIDIAGKIRAGASMLDDALQHDSGHAETSKGRAEDRKRVQNKDAVKGVNEDKVATDVGALVEREFKASSGDASPEAVKRLIADAQNQARESFGQKNWNQLSEEEKYRRDTNVAGSIAEYVNAHFSLNDTKASVDEILAKGVPLAQTTGKLAGQTASMQGGWGDVTGAQQSLDLLQSMKAKATAAANLPGGRPMTETELATINEQIATSTQALATATLAKMDALNALAVSVMSPFDKSGRIGAQIEGLKAKMAVPGQDAATVAADQAKLNDLANQQAQQGVADVASARTAAVGPFDKAGDAMAKYRNADAQLAFVQNSGATGQDLSDAQKARSDAHVAATQALNEEASSARMAKIDPRDKVGEAAEKLKQAYVQYNMVIKYKGKGKDLADAIRGVNEAKIAAATAAVEDANAFRDANVAIGDKSGALEAKVADLRALAGTQIGSQRAATLRQAQEAQLAHVQYQSTLSNAIDNSFIDPTSTLEKSRQGVKEATRTLNDIMTEPEYWKDDAYWKARGDLIAKQIEQAQAEAEAASNVRLLSMDMTNPVQMAQEEARKAQEKLARDRGRGAAGDVLVSDEIDVRNKQAAVESAAFSQNLNAATVANTLGRTSHAAYISYLQQQHSNLTQQIAGMGMLDQGRQAAQDRLDQIDQALKGANEQMQGQFNLGQIKVPTVYEVRRSIAAEAGGHTYQDHSVSQVSIAVNGADMVAVKALLESYLGSGLGSRTVSTRKV